MANAGYLPAELILIIANDVFMLVNVTAQVDGGRTVTQEQYVSYSLLLTVS